MHTLYKRICDFHMRLPVLLHVGLLAASIGSNGYRVNAQEIDDTYIFDKHVQSWVDDAFAVDFQSISDWHIFQRLAIGVAWSSAKARPIEFSFFTHLVDRTGRRNITEAQLKHLVALPKGAKVVTGSVQFEYGPKLKNAFERARVEGTGCTSLGVSEKPFVVFSWLPKELIVTRERVLTPGCTATILVVYECDGDNQDATLARHILAERWHALATENGPLAWELDWKVESNAVQNEDKH